MFRFRSINQYLLKIKDYARLIDTRGVYSLILIVVIGTGSYILGGLTVLDSQKGSVVIERCELYPSVGSNPQIVTEPKSTIIPAVLNQNQGLYVGSKQGNRFHLPDCPGAKQISEANKIWFGSKEEALSLGYTPAGNCKGI